MSHTFIHNYDDRFTPWRQDSQTDFNFCSLGYVTQLDRSWHPTDWYSDILSILTWKTMFLSTIVCVVWLWLWLTDFWLITTALREVWACGENAAAAAWLAVSRRQVTLDWFWNVDKLPLISPLHLREASSTLSHASLKLFSLIFPARNEAWILKTPKHCQSSKLNNYEKLILKNCLSPSAALPL